MINLIAYKIFFFHKILFLYIIPVKVVCIELRRSLHSNQGFIKTYLILLLCWDVGPLISPGNKTLILQNSKSTYKQKFSQRSVRLYAVAVCIFKK